MPVHNGEHYLAQALESIAAQTFEDWEAVIVDDASSDGSLELARAFARRHPSQVQVIALGHNVGVAEARNAAIRAARGGRLVVLLDQDDYLLQGYLARAVELFDAAAAARPGIVACNGLIETQMGIEATFAERYWWRDELDLDRMLECNYILARAMFSRAAFEEVGGFDPRCLTADDYDLWLRLLEAGYAVVTTREPLVVYRIHAAAQSRDKRRLAEGSLAAYRRALARGALTPRQRRTVRARIRHYGAVRDRTAVGVAISERRFLHAGGWALRAAPSGLLAFLQNPQRWAEWLRPPLPETRPSRRPA